MAQELVVKEPLTEQMVRAGMELTRQLDAEAFEVVASFWLYTSEANDWRLVVASPRVDEVGPKAAYEIVQDVLHRNAKQLAPLTLQTIAVLSPSNSTVRLLGAVGRIEGLANVRVSRSVFNGTLIEDAYIYRLAL